jgi:predicted O-linked N-acetylglucosamine transferase (SPINDLY family)
MDYYIADRCFLPLREFADQFTEKLVLLRQTRLSCPTKGDRPSIRCLPTPTGTSHSEASTD